jgi:hypothetical protein
VIVTPFSGLKMNLDAHLQKELGQFQVVLMVGPSLDAPTHQQLTHVLDGNISVDIISVVRTLKS